MRLKPWLQRHPLLSYFALAYGISWGGIGLWLAARGFPLAALGPLETAIVFVPMLLGPSLAGLALTAWLDGGDGIRALGSRLLRWKVGLRWYAVALLTTPLLLLAVLWPLSILVDAAFAPGFKPALFAIGLVAGSFEEIGWSGFATPRLLHRYRLPVAGLMLGIVWALWHLLADACGNLTTMGNSWFAWFAVFWIAALPPYRLLMTWVYTHTQSLLLAVLMHAGYTGWLFVLYPATSFEQGLVWQGMFAASLWVAAAIVWCWAAYGGEPVIRRP